MPALLVFLALPFLRGTAAIGIAGARASGVAAAPPPPPAAALLFAAPPSGYEVLRNGAGDEALPFLRGIGIGSSLPRASPTPEETAVNEDGYELLQAGAGDEAADVAFGADSFGHHASVGALAEALRDLGRGLRRRRAEGSPFWTFWAHHTIARTEGTGRAFWAAAPKEKADDNREGWEEPVAFIVGVIVFVLIAICVFCAFRRHANNEAKEKARLEYEERERKGEEIRRMVLEAQAREDAEREKRRIERAEQAARDKEEQMRREEEERAKREADERLRRAKRITRKALERHAKKVEQERLKQEEAAKEPVELCRKCGKPILDTFVTVEGRQYHETCFTCAMCMKPISGSAFVLTLDGPICQRCDEKQAIKCFKCGERIKGKIMKVDGRSYHEACCTCSRCGGPISDSYFPSDDGIICDKCDEEEYLAGLPVCVVCQQRIEDKHPIVDGKPMHKACFVCNMCNTPIIGSYYKSEEDRGGYVCEKCHQKSP